MPERFYMSKENKWFIFADEDWIMAKRALEDGIFNQTCFHSQQGVEKLLKGFLQDSKKKIPKTHSLVELLNLCAGINSTLANIEEDCIKLDRYYIPTRYPDALPGTLPEGLPSKKDAETALAILDKVAKLIKKD